MNELIQSLKISIHTLLESFGYNIEFNPSDYDSMIKKTDHPNIEETIIINNRKYGTIKVDIFTFGGKSELFDLYIHFEGFTSSQNAVALGFLRKTLLDCK